LSKSSYIFNIEIERKTENELTVVEELRMIRAAALEEVAPSSE
jgi:hypothetical protein